jgi:hypothetical protein
MLTNEEDISLANLAGGAAIELFDRELKHVLKNITDKNRDPKFKRKITLTVTFEPTDTEGTMVVKICPETKLAGRSAITTTVLYGKDPLTGYVDAKELASRQRQLPFPMPETQIPGQSG